MASCDYQHCGDHAVVSFSGDLTTESVVQLVGMVDSLIDEYFYRSITVGLSSPGGATRALDPWLSALSRWRVRGVVVSTYVGGNASSMAALVFAMGDVRVLDAHAQLFFHSSRILEARDVTVADTVRMYGVLRRLDKRHVASLVDRVLRIEVPRPALAHRALAQASDSDLVGFLLRGLGLGARSSYKAGARALARYVDGALGGRDRSALKRLYRLLLRRESSLSPRLARTLGLADSVVESARAVEPAGALADASALVVPEWRSLYPPHGAVPRAALTRHLLALGETGSGKTLSAILPPLAAMARAPRRDVSGALVIDPKGELAPVLRALVGADLQHLDPSALVLDLMDAPQWRLHEHLAQKRWVTAASTILSRMRGFSRAGPLRVLGPHAAGSSNAEFFDREGVSLARDVIAFLLMLSCDRDVPATPEWLVFTPPPAGTSRGDDACDDDTSEGGSPARPPSDVPSDRFATGSGAHEQASPAWDADDPRRWLSDFYDRAHGGGGARGSNIVALSEWALGTALVQVSDYDVPWLWARLAVLALPGFGADSTEARELLGRVRAYWGPSASVRAQHMGVVASARNVVTDFAVPCVAQTVYFGCELGLEQASGVRVDFARFVSCDEPAEPLPRFLLYSPSRDGADVLVAAALKARFFECVFVDEHRRSGGPDLPLLGYVADECHRYVTSDPVHGEAHFLDAARSFGCASILATHSLSSLELALAQGSGGETERRASVDTFWVNTGTKLVFRTTDERVVDLVQEMTPYRPGRAPVTRVRPLSALPPGSCYGFVPMGTFGLHQLEPFDARAPSAAPALAPPANRSRRKRRKGARPRLEAPS